MFVISLKAGGTGLNLTRATHVIHYDRWWNPAVEDQATDRAWRIGQDRPVQVHRHVCEGTVEDRIAALLAAKRGLADSVVGGGEAWVTELGDDDLADLVALGGGVDLGRSTADGTRLRDHVVGPGLGRRPRGQRRRTRQPAGPRPHATRRRTAAPSCASSPVA